MTSLPPLRDLPPGALERRRRHLLSEIATPRRRAPRRPVPSFVAVIALALVALLLVAPWEGSPTLADRALAALGDEPVLHVVTEQNDWHPPLVDIESGESRTQTIRTEIWFDERRGMKRTVQHIDDVLMDEVLETPQGGYTRAGPLITCAWIAAHPVEATKRRVSCNESMENRTTPRKIPEKPPTLVPTLAGFVDGYRAALDAGVAKELRRDAIDGREVVWLRFPPPARPARGPEFPPTDVAVDADTFKPLRIHSGDERTTVRVAETLPYDERVFPRPELAPPGPSSGRMGERETIDLGTAARLLRRPPLWLGSDWQGFRLVEVRRIALTTGYPRSSGRDPEFADAVQLAYEHTDGRSLTLNEAASCHHGLMRGVCGPREPREGELRVWWVPHSFNARVEGVHLFVEHGTVEPLELARALAAVPEGQHGP